MRRQKIHTRTLVRALIAFAVMLATTTAAAQSKQYQRKAKPVEAAPAAAPAAGSPAAPAAAGDKSEKLDISELEQKYWAPKDTDFSVVQNRTYNKAKRIAVSGLIGPTVNDPYNAGMSYAVLANYYFDERTGVEFQYIKSDLTNSDATKEFLKLSGGSAPPDFNRPVEFYGVGYNWVPFYAKMSVLGSKIIYFDMQFTPIIGMSTYEQQAQTGSKTKTAFTYGIDITQYYFLHKNFAVRMNYQNRWSSQEVLAWNTGVKRRTDNDNTSLFLVGGTFFF